MNINIAKCSLRASRQSVFSHFHISRNIGDARLFAICQCPSLGSNITSKAAHISTKWAEKDYYFRFMSTESSGPPSTKLPSLMDFPKITWPSLIKSIRNFILSTFIIKPYFDKDFSLADFVAGAKKAVEVVSKKLSEGDVKSLEGLVSSDIVTTLQQATASMSLSQREQIAVNFDDIYFGFPYQIGVIFNDENSQRRFVEVTMVFHILRGLAEMKQRGEEPPINIGMMPEYQSKMSIANYRFIKEFTKGVESDWTINLLNHFRPIDLLDN